MLGAVPALHVAVYQTHDRSSAHLGELSVASLAARGCAGAVIDGGCRDVAAILSEVSPSSHATSRRRTASRVGSCSATRAEITVGAVRVSPGDWIVADADGIVVVPGAVSEETLERAEAIVATESEVRAAVRAGTLPREAFERYGKF